MVLSGFDAEIGDCIYGIGPLHEALRSEPRVKRLVEAFFICPVRSRKMCLEFYPTPVRRHVGSSPCVLLVHAAIARVSQDVVEEPCCLSIPVAGAEPAPESGCIGHK